jgi:hypothetical protein
MPPSLGHDGVNQRQLVATPPYAPFCTWTSTEIDCTLAKSPGIFIFSGFPAFRRPRPSWQRPNVGRCLSDWDEFVPLPQAAHDVQTDRSRAGSRRPALPASACAPRPQPPGRWARPHPPGARSGGVPGRPGRARRRLCALVVQLRLSGGHLLQCDHLYHSPGSSSGRLAGAVSWQATTRRHGHTPRCRKPSVGRTAAEERRRFHGRYP